MNVASVQMDVTTPRTDVNNIQTDSENVASDRFISTNSFREKLINIELQHQNLIKSIITRNIMIEFYRFPISVD